MNKSKKFLSLLFGLSAAFFALNPSPSLIFAQNHGSNGAPSFSGSEFGGGIRGINQADPTMVALALRADLNSVSEYFNNSETVNPEFLVSKLEQRFETADLAQQQGAALLVAAFTHPEALPIIQESLFGIRAGGNLGAKLAGKLDRRIGYLIEHHPQAYRKIAEALKPLQERLLPKDFEAYSEEQLRSHLDWYFSGEHTVQPYREGLVPIPQGCSTGLRPSELQQSSRRGGRHSGNVRSDEGITIFGRAERYYAEIQRMVKVLHEMTGGKIDLSESLNVMDDTFESIRSKLRVIQKIAQNKKVDNGNVHLYGTLTWVDGLVEKSGKNTVIHTHRVFFHPTYSRDSKVAEAIRRTDKFLMESLPLYAHGGKAENELQKQIDEINLVIDTQGLPEIKEHIQKMMANDAYRLGRDKDRYRILFLDDPELQVEPAASKATMKRELNRLIDFYRSKPGLADIIEGVTYSRYVGLLLELKTIEHFLRIPGPEPGSSLYEVLQSGRDIVDSEGRYKTELDVVIRNRVTGHIFIVESKSARVTLPDLEKDIWEGKIKYKLDVYRKERVLLDRAVGLRPDGTQVQNSHFDGVKFALDVGFNTEIEAFLQEKAKLINDAFARGDINDPYYFGFPVEFVFIESHPEDDEFYTAPPSPSSNGHHRRH